MSKRKPTSIHFLISLLFALIAVCPALAQSSSQDSSLAVTASASTERVRFTAPSSVAQMRLEVLTDSGQTLFDIQTKGNVFDWHLQDGQAERLGNGTYLCVVTVKTISGKLAQKIGTLTIADGQVVLAPAQGSQLSGQLSQAVGPVEEDAALAVISQDETPPTTVIANNGEEGQIVRTKGALSFRLGDFYNGKDSEQMRLTEDGNLGIGTDNPQAKLDVAGLIRTTEGIQFADGTLLHLSAQGGLKVTLPSGKTETVNLTSSNMTSAGTNITTAGVIPKFADNSGNLTNSIISESNNQIVIAGNQLINPVGATPTYEVLAGSDPSTTVMLTTNSSNFGWQIAPTNASNDTIVQVLGQTFSLPASRGEFGIYLGANSNSAFKVIQRGGSELFRVNRTGNVGIGTSIPLHQLAIFGGPGWTTDNWGGALELQNAAAIGWRANSSGLRFGIGRTNTGLAFFRTASELGTTASGPIYDMLLDNSGNLGLGAIGLNTSLASKLNIFAQDGLKIAGFQPFLTLTDTNASNKSAFMQGVGGDAVLLTNGRQALTLKDGSGYVGIGTTTPPTPLSIGGGASWTQFNWSAALSMDNVAALGWRNNTAGQSFGMGQTNDGFHLFRAASNPGVNGGAITYDLSVNNSGEIGLGGNIKQALGSYGLVKAMVSVNADGTIAACYNSQLQGTASTTVPCGFTVTRQPLDQLGSPGTFSIDLGSVTSSFISVTPRPDLSNLNIGYQNTGADAIIGTSTVSVLTFYGDQRTSRTYTGFYLIVY